MILSTAAWVSLSLLAGCAPEKELPPPVKPPETLRLEAAIGTFADYYAEVLRISRRHPASPDSFRMALRFFPGSHLSEEEWAAWTAPCLDRPDLLAADFEEVLEELSLRR
jgi:hypothetical protein